MNFYIRIESKYPLTYIPDDEDGPYFGEEHTIYVNETEIWYSKSDGHMWAEQSDKPLVDSFLEYWYDSHLQEINSFYTEEERIKYNEKHPGNGVARTQESWKEHKKHQIEVLRDSWLQIKCEVENVPSDMLRRLKVVSLWIQESYDEDSFFFEESKNRIGV
jgi:hypothetical protein